jgi:lipid-binding SYLF domain-containing protein
MMSHRIRFRSAARSPLVTTGLQACLVLAVSAMFVVTALAENEATPIEDEKSAEKSDAGSGAPEEVKSEKPDDPANEVERASMAGQVLHEMMTGEDREIPQALLDKAQGIAVIPHVVKGAFLVGGKFGKGLVTKRTEDGSWSRPIYVDLGGVSYGFQAGVEATDLILVFIEKDGVESLLDDAVKLGADVSITAGPIGRTAEASTNLTLDSAIYAYSRSKGVFAGVSLDGAVLSVDDSANEVIYGPKVDPREVLLKSGPIPEAVEPFMRAVETHAEEGDAQHGG